MSSLDTLREHGFGTFVETHPLQFGLAVGLFVGVFAFFNGGSPTAAFFGFFVVGSLLALVYSYTSVFFRAAHSVAESYTTTDEADPNRALHQLRERYAKGELSEAEFERKLEQLLETETRAAAEDHLTRRETDLATE
ncbi:SHOCT domain-containing protein [Haloferax namakaokahaiae]|uniref:SHOCT domain-containing protein n=1 Tax=Haloferax namakaokahaiae TaxID=1748331 RepID=A0ABD5ZDB6_9EURY